MGMGGVISTAFRNFELRCINSYSYIFPEYLAYWIKEMRQSELPVNILISGALGCGKSTAASIIYKCTEPDKPFDEKHVIFAEDPDAVFLRKLNSLKNDTVVIDELYRFLNSRAAMTRESISILNYFEVARARNVATISCCNSYFKIDRAFRTTQVSMVIQLFDRRKKDSELGVSCGAVFAAPTLTMADDRFGLDYLSDVHSEQEFVNLAPFVHSFKGFIFFPNRSEYVSEKEWDNYSDAKARGIQRVFTHGISRMAKEDSNYEVEKQ